MFVSTYLFLLAFAVSIVFALVHISSQIQATVSIKEQSVLQTTRSTPKTSSKIAFLLEGFAPTPFPTVKPTPIPTPFPPKSWTCATVPILMYHHVEPIAQAQAEGHAQLTVDASVFAQQLSYIQERGYTTITLTQLANFFDTGTGLPNKPIILTFDDGYSDFFTYATPALSSRNMKAEFFVSTGLVENPGYVTWDQIQQIKNQGISISHHTWSHANIASGDSSVFARELDTASGQLTEHGYGPVRVFAYPYGSYSSRSIEALQQRNFSIAVTTKPGRIQCKEQRFELPRIRVGNSSLSSYGL